MSVLDRFSMIERVLAPRILVSPAQFEAIRQSWVPGNFGSTATPPHEDVFRTILGAPVARRAGLGKNRWLVEISVYGAECGVVNLGTPPSRGAMLLEVMDFQRRG